MLKIGCHISISAGYLAAAKTAKEIGANCFQYFSRNPRGGAAKGVDLDDIARFKLFATKNDMYPCLAHAPYTLNAGSANPDTRGFANSCFESDIKTLAHFDSNVNYVFHPGSHTELARSDSIDYVIAALNKAVNSDIAPIVLLEAMSGKGSELGSTFNELKLIINGVKDNTKLGVCLDTCHIYSAGYDIVNNLDGVLSEFDNKIGLDRLHAVHLNDSMMPFASKKDRHAKIGEGTIGFDAIVKIVNHTSLRHLPFYLETPNELDGYAKEIELLRANYSS